MNSRVLLIVGMHRSGTSLITNWLQQCGLFVGSQLVGVDIGNAEGHFEDKEFLYLHKQFLKKRKQPSTGFVVQKISPLDFSELKDLKALIEKRNVEHAQWGWKEPRTVLFLNGYKQLLPQANYLFIIRSFTEVVSSLLTRNYKARLKKIHSQKGITKLWQLLKKKSLKQVSKKYGAFYLKLWILYNQEIIDQIKLLSPKQYHVVRYSTLLNEDEFIFNKLTSEWNFSLFHIPFKNVFKKDLISEGIDVESYITNKSLIAKAREMERCLERHLSEL